MHRVCLHRDPVEAMRRGATDYLPKPSRGAGAQVLRKITKTRKLEGRVADLESRLRADSPDAD